MKKIFTLISLLPLVSAAYGQAITITAADMPVPTGSYNIMDMTNPGMPSSAIPGTNITWDYGLYNGSAYSEDYVPETDAFFTAAGVDVNYLSGKGLIDGFYYDLYSELDFNSANVNEVGISIPYQLFDLSIATGNPGDSMSIPAQKYLLTQTAEIVHFPLTMSTAWHSVSRRSTNFSLTVTPFYTDAPSQHVYYVHRDDTVVGWGKMRVYALTGPSAYYDVLMDKVSEYAVDSFYISGAPANPLVLSSFGISQGQHTDSAFYYNFYRKGSYNYLANFDYNTDATYTTLDAAYSHTDNIMPSGINGVNNVLFSTVLFPNPVNGNEVNLKVMGGNVNMASYIITDITGKAVQTGAIDKGTTQLHIDMAASLNNGTYILNIVNDKNENVINEQFSVVR